jgi:phosphomannomutase
MIDGIRISENGGWVLVLPDASEAAVNVIAESTSDESAEGTAANMAEHITHLIATG